MVVATAEQAQIGKKRIQLHEGQTAVFQSDARFCALIAGTGGGKTYIGPYWLAREIAKNPTGIFGVGAPTFKMLERVTARELVTAYRGTNLEGEYKASRGEYHLPTGGTIYLCSTTDPDHIEGGQYAAWWLDEAGQMSAWTWVVIQARLGFQQGRCLFTTTPYNLGWLYRDVYLRAKEGDPDYFVSQFKSTLNPQYPQAELVRAKRTMDERTFQMRYGGQFRKMAGLVYPDMDSWFCSQEDAQEAAERAEQYPESHRWVGGIDWGYNNPFVALTGFVDNDDVLWLISERYATEKLLKDHAPELDDRCNYYADPSGKQQIEEMIALGCMVEGADNAVAMGIERVIARGKTGRLRISPDCVQLRNESETYHYKEDKDAPVKVDDHACDALRYLVAGLDGVPEPQIISLSYGNQTEEDIILSEDPTIWRDL